MILKILTFIFILSFVSVVFSQDNIIIHPGLGYFIFHSENNLDVTDDDNLDFTFNAGLSVSFTLNANYNLLLETEYIHSVPSKVLESEIVDENGLENGKTYFELSQNSFTFDVSMLYPISSRLKYGIGPSFGLLNRRLEQKLSIDELKLTDELFSIGVGAVFYLQHKIRFNKYSKLFLQTKIKSRYLYSIWFDAKNRDLDNYSLHYLNIAGYIGIGYQF